MVDVGSYSRSHPIADERPRVACLGDAITASSATIGASPRRLRSIVGGSIGNLIEWYDFHVYTTFAVYFVTAFFPPENRTIQLLSAAAIFAIGFILRPIGSWLIGLYADRQGRRAALTVSVTLMCGGSLAIGLCPSYTQIGLVAPLVLLVARLVQGFSLGGESGAGLVYLSEIAPPHRRGFFSSFFYVTTILGQLIATGIQIALQDWVLSSSQLHAWGWRIPFLGGAALALLAFWVRRNIVETTAFEQVEPAAKRKVGLRELLQYRRPVALIFTITVGGTLAFFTFTVYMHNYLINTVGLNAQQSAWVSIAILGVFMLLQPLLGLLSDRIGRKPLLVAFGVGGTFGTWPLLQALSHAHSAWLAFCWLSLALAVVSCYTSVSPVLKSSLFPAHIRALGVGFPYAIATSIFGGTAGYVGLYFKSVGHESGFYLYASACVACTLVAAICLRTNDLDYLDSRSTR